MVPSHKFWHFISELLQFRVFSWKKCTRNLFFGFCLPSLLTSARLRTSLTYKKRIHPSVLLKHLNGETDLSDFERWIHFQTQRSCTSRFQTRKPTAPACFSGSNWQILCFLWDETNYLFKKAEFPVKCLQPETISWCLAENAPLIWLRHILYQSEYHVRRDLHTILKVHLFWDLLLTLV